MTRSRLKRLTEEDRFAKKYACWAKNHGGWGKAKKVNRRIARRKLKREEKKMLVNFHCETGLAGCDLDEIMELPDNMTEEEIDAECKEWVFNQIEYSWWQIDESETE